MPADIGSAPAPGSTAFYMASARAALLRGEPSAAEASLDAVTKLPEAHFEFLGDLAILMPVDFEAPLPFSAAKGPRGPQLAALRDKLIAEPSLSATWRTSGGLSTGAGLKSPLQEPDAVGVSFLDTLAGTATQQWFSSSHLSLQQRQWLVHEGVLAGRLECSAVPVLGNAENNCLYIAMQLSRLPEPGGDNAEPTTLIRKLSQQELQRLQLYAEHDKSATSAFAMTFSPSSSAFVPHAVMCLLLKCGESATTATSSDTAVCKGGTHATVYISAAVQDPTEARAASSDGIADNSVVARLERSCWEAVRGAAARGWQRLKEQHSRQFAARMAPTALRIHPRSRPSQAKLKDTEQDEQEVDKAPLLFSLSRYLLLSAGDALPPTLQGLWADGRRAAWSGDFHLNINLQMAYWAADGSGIASHVLPPLTRWLSGLRVKGGKLHAVARHAKGIFIIWASGHF